MLHQKFVSEIRFIPQPGFIDIRGKVASAMSSGKSSDWKISNDRVDIVGSDGVAFASYNNLGFITLKKENLNFYIERIDEVLKLMENLPPTRWGVRIYSFIESKKKFESLVKKYTTKLLRFNPRDFSKINGELKDVGISYVFRRDRNMYHVSIGPMEKDQASQFFPPNKLPKRGIFVDLDIYREKDDFYKDDFRRSRITDFIKTSFADAEEIVKELISIINDK